MIQLTDTDKKYAADLDNMPRHFSAFPIQNGKCILDDTWCIVLSGENEIAQNGALSLVRFLDKYCKLTLPMTIGGSGKPHEIRIGWNGNSGEGYTITVESDLVEVCGDSPAGALYGAYRLQWMMCENGGSYLDMGNFHIEPKAKTRIVSTSFHQGYDNGDDPLTYTDGYLDLMANYGHNGLHMYIDLFNYVENLPYVPELEDEKAADRIQRLAELAKRAAAYNVGVYLHLNATRRDKNTLIFKNHPELQGADYAEHEMCCFCSSEPLTTRIYADVINGIIEKVPNVKGLIGIIGGECFLHCYSRPHPRTDKGTNCPRCADKEPSRVVADFANSVAGQVWDVNPDIEFMVWPYSAHLWSESLEQKELFPLLDKRMGFMTCFDKDAKVNFDGVEFAIFDYSISYVGPSEQYLVQRELAAKNNLKIYIKTESSIALEMLIVPYIPAMENWRNRWKGMMSDSIYGYLANWRFSGFTGTLSEEIAYKETWKSNSEKDSLEQIAGRLCGDAKENCLEAWKYFSKAFSEVPFCVGLSGYAYFRGPMYLGPAHPMIFYSEESKRLPESFLRVDPCLVEFYGDDEEKMNEAFGSMMKMPLYFDDGRWTVPLGIEKMKNRLEMVCDLWDNGISIYKKVYDELPESAKAAMKPELSAALMTGTVLKTARNLACFQIEKKRALDRPLYMKEAQEIHARLKEIVEMDLENAKLGLELAKEDYRFGYGFVYGKAFDADMIQAKIDFTKSALLSDIDEFFGIIIGLGLGEKTNLSFGHDAAGESKRSADNSD